MALGEHDHDMTRRYLLGQLTDDEEQLLEERLLSDDDFFQEVELTKDELAQEYVSGELTAKERKWLQENFLASPQGKQRREFAKTFDHYVKNRRAQHPKSPSLIERVWKFLNSYPQLLRATSAVALLVIAVGVYSTITTRGPRSVATLTVTSSQGTRSAVGGSVPGVKLNHDELKLILMLPQAVSPGSAFRVEVSDNNVTQTFETRAVDTQFISVEIPATKLPRGLYGATVSTVDANGNAHRTPDNYTFKVE